MAKKKKTHTMKILIKFLNGETVVSSDIFASNTNQYFGHIKDEGIKLIEWNDPKEGRHLKRKLETSEENIKKAREYLRKLEGCGNGS
jgi:hypothetical protein